MTDTAYGWWLFGGYGVNLIAQGLDSYLTTIGLDHGLKEGNPVSRFLINKIGSVATTGVKMGAVPLIAVVVESVFKIPGYVNLFMAAATLPIVVRNYFLLKKNKISAKW